MKKNRNIVSILTLIIATFMISCEDFELGTAFLDKPMSDDLNIDSVFGKKIYAEQALAEAYHSLPDFLPTDGRLSWSMLEMITDLGDHTKGSPGYYSLSFDASNINDAPYRLDCAPQCPGKGPIDGIRRAYIYIENVDRVPDMSEEEKSVTKAEAKLIIAYHYSQMFRYYGGMPWISHAYSPKDNMRFERMTVEETVNKIVSLIDEAAAGLPWSVSRENDGHLTAAAAYALKQRLLLFAASPLFNSEKPYKDGEAAQQKLVWYGNYDKNRWERALEAGREFLDKNYQNHEFYKLVSTGDPRADFVAGYAHRYNHETLISSRRYTTMTKNFKSLSQIRYGVTCPTQNYVDMFQRIDGTDFDWNNPDHVRDLFFDKDKNPTRDPRLYETMGVNQDKWQGKDLLPLYKGAKAKDPYNRQNHIYNGTVLRKFVRNWADELIGSFYSCPLLRLPEVYLGLAEAMNELDIATVKDQFGFDAYDYINKVRSRAGMPAVTPDLVKPGKALREYILDERAREFGFEEVRYFDLVRYKRSDLFCKKLYRLETTVNEDAATKDAMPFIHVRKAGMKQNREFAVPANWDDKRFLVPLPTDEINKKYGLIQNPGW